MIHIRVQGLGLELCDFGFKIQGSGFANSQRGPPRGDVCCGACLRPVYVSRPTMHPPPRV